MRLKIQTSVLCSFSMVLVLLTCIAAVAIDRTRQIETIAGNLNGRVVNKTKIADDIVALGQQIRFVDGFILASNNAHQDGLADLMIKDRVAALEAKTQSFLLYVDSDLERSLLRNLQRSRQAYLQAQAEVLSTGIEERQAGAEADEQRLAVAFDQANTQARGLAHLAESEARAGRQQAVDIARSAEITILIVSGLAFAVGSLILLFLHAAIFRPLTHTTRALLSLAEGRLDVALFSSRRGGEIDAMARALDVFRRNAIALAASHEETKAAHQLADSLARHDALTGLPNRRVIAATIEDAIGRSSRLDRMCAVLLLDLDRFKPVNDIYGHGAGDRVLVEVAERIKAATRSGETAARLGGDEFAVVIEFEPGSDAPLRFAKRITASIAAPIAINGHSVSVGTSIGIAVWPADGEDAEVLLHAADLAMFKAKREERGSFRFFEPEMDVQLRARADLEARIQKAIDDGSIRPHYQPLVDLRLNIVIGFEILARWHDGGTIRAPGEFIPVAEEAGLIPALTYSVLRQACRDAQPWPETLTLALNVTPAQITDLRLPQILLQLLAEERFPASRLELEITENALIGDVTAARHVIDELRANGIKISLDDFGIGYSSLHHLRNMKFDKIKIDRSFVQSMMSNVESTKIIETILGLGRSLGVRTIAEGIENVEHLTTLLAQGCEYGQGYHLGRPLAAGSVGALLESYRANRADRAQAA